MTAPLSNPYAVRATLAALTELFDRAQAARHVLRIPYSIRAIALECRSRDCTTIGRRQSNNLTDSLAASMILLLRLIAVVGARLPPAAVQWRIAVLALATVVPAELVGQAWAENSEIGVRRSAERTSFTDAEITEGFFKVAFGAEMQIGPRAERIRKFAGAARVYVVNRGVPDRRGEVAAVVADIRAHVHHLDLAMTDDRSSANVVVTLVHKRDFKQTVRSVFGSDRAAQIERLLSPQCLSGFAKDQRYRISRAEVILPVDAGEFMFYDCAYEELLQALGPINDDSSVPWTMFNDDVQMGFFDRYDQYLLNILYDPSVRPGMTRLEVGLLLPQILPSVRAWVTAANASTDADRHLASDAR